MDVIGLSNLKDLLQPRKHEKFFPLSEGSRRHLQRALKLTEPDYTSARWELSEPYFQYLVL